jgi:hypothetical protein
MNTKEAINYLDIIKKSFDANTAPRFSKEIIEQERAKATQALNLAIKLLEGEVK